MGIIKFILFNGHSKPYKQVIGYIVVHHTVFVNNAHLNYITSYNVVLNKLNIT